MTRTTSMNLTLLAVLLLPVAANAAFISIDDTDKDTITISVNDFEGCFSVNGLELSCGLGDPQSITLADDTVWSFEGTWIDLGASTSNSGAHYFGLMGEVFSGVEWSVYTNGFYGTIRGAFTGLDLCCSYGPPSNGVLNPQDGSTRDFSQPYLSATFTSEVAVPEPGTLGPSRRWLRKRRSRGCAPTRRWKIPTPTKPDIRAPCLPDQVRFICRMAER